MKIDRIDTRRGIVRSATGKATQLGPTSGRLLSVLAEAGGEVVSKDALLAAVWPDTHVTEDSLYHAVAEIRKGLGSDGAKILQTKARQGYFLSAPEPVSAPVRVLSGVRLARMTGLAGLGAAMALAAVLTFRTPEPADALSVAVLPFKSAGLSDRLDLFTTSMAGEISTAIAENGWLHVYGAEAAKDARFSLTGILQEDADRLRVMANLTETATGRVVWSKTWDGAAGEFLDFQVAIASDAAAHLGGHWSGSVVRHDAMAAAARPTDSLDAYELYLRATQAKHRFTPEAYDEARALLHRSLAIDPGFAKAWATLSVVESLAVDNAKTRSDLERILEARSRAALRAYELAPDDPATLSEYAWLQSWRGERAAARETYRRAVSLAPQNADVLAYAALASNLTGAMGDEGVAWIKRARQLNPAPPNWYVIAEGFAHFGAENWKEAIRVLEESPNPVSKHLFSMAAWHALGEPEKAQNEADALLRTAPNYRIDFSVYADAMDMDGSGGRLIEAGLAYGLPTGDFLSALLPAGN